MTTPQVDRLRWLARNSAPVTLPALAALWHCSDATVRHTLDLCGYVPVGSNWHHPDHVPEPAQPNPLPEPLPAPAAPPALRILRPPAATPHPSPLTRNPSPVRRPAAWVTVDPLDLADDLQATKVTRTWLLANVAPDQWPHPHRQPCHDCQLWQPCSALSRHRQATICEAVITQRRIDHANLPSQPDIHRTPARLCPPGQEDLRTLYPAQNASLAAG